MLGSDHEEHERRRRMVRIVGDGTPRGTRVFNADGIEIEVRSVTLHATVGELPKATLEVLAVGGNVQAEVTEIEKIILPPPLPKEKLVMTIGEPVWRGLRRRCAYRVERSVPTRRISPDIEGGGAIMYLVDGGWMDPIGPLRFERELEPLRGGEMPVGMMVA